MAVKFPRSALKKGRHSRPYSLLVMPSLSHLSSLFIFLHFLAFLSFISPHCRFVSSFLRVTTFFCPFFLSRREYIRSSSSWLVYHTTRFFSSELVILLT